MLTVMRSPSTYTGEDTAEINCHGGLLTARQVLALCLQNGARTAEPGEFTKRAFLNGRLDLTQAEAVMDVIKAKTDRSQGAAVRALEGHLSAKVNALRERLITILAHIEAHIDFPDEDISPNTHSELENNLESVLEALRGLLATAREGKILREGILVAIVGRPNVGKSSVMNALLGQDRSIVTAIPGTTRDTIEEIANGLGIPVRLTDTAGIRTTLDEVKQHGVARSHNTLAHTDIAMHILDSSQPHSDTDSEIASHCAQKPTITVLNKVDLPRRLELPEQAQGRRGCVEMSALTGLGLEELRNQIAKIAQSGEAGSVRYDVAINERHAEVLLRAKNSLTGALDCMRSMSPLELVAQQLCVGLNAVGEIVGKTTTEDILARVFSTFCIGK